MFHLFAGVCVYPDILTPGFSRQIVISRFKDYPIVDGKQSILKQLLQDDRATIYHYQNFKQCIDNNHGLYNFLQFVYQHSIERPNIYADKQSYAELVCTFLKFLFNNKLTAKRAYRLYKLSLDKFFIKDALINHMHGGMMLLDYQQIVNDHLFRILSQTQFQSIYDSVVFVDDDTFSAFRKKIIKEISLEFQIAARLHKCGYFDEMLNYQLKNAILQHIVDGIGELKDFTLWQIYRKQSINTPIDQAISVVDRDNLLSSDILYRVDKTINPDQYTQDIQQCIQALQNLQYEGWDDVNTNNVSHWVKLIQPDVTTKQIVDDMLHNRFNTIELIIYYTSINNINPLLMFDVFDKYSSNVDIEEGVLLNTLTKLL